MCWCQMHSKQRTQKYQQHYRNYQNKRWTMLLCFVLCELKFKRFRLVTHFAQQQHKHTHTHTNSVKEERKEKETPIHLRHWFDCCWCCHSHIYMIWVVWQPYDCVVNVRVRLFRKASIGKCAARIVINHIYSMMWTKVMVSSSLFANW